MRGLKPVIKNIYQLDIYHFSISMLLAGFNLWMINNTSKQIKEFEEYKTEWYRNKLK
jgi:hypothetical protein